MSNQITSKLLNRCQFDRFDVDRRIIFHWDAHFILTASSQRQVTKLPNHDKAGITRRVAYRREPGL